MSVGYELLVAIIILAGAATLQFFRGRRLNILLMEHYLKSIEPILRPYQDKNYTWLGGYVGYRAMYAVNRKNIRTFEYTLVLLPRQSLLYFPISLLTSRHDKIFFVVRPYSQIKRNIHVIQKHYYRIKPKIEEEEILEKTTIEVKGVKYDVLYERKKDIGFIVRFLESMPNVKDVKHVSLTLSTNVFYVLLRPRPETARECAKKIVDFVNIRLKEHFEES